MAVISKKNFSNVRQRTSGTPEYLSTLNFLNPLETESLVSQTYQNQWLSKFSNRMITTPKYWCKMFCVPQIEFWCTFGGRYGRARNSFNPICPFTCVINILIVEIKTLNTLSVFLK